MSSSSVPWSVALVSGGMAGTFTDVALFPLDTIKTRLQSKQGFIKAGGFKQVYSGLGPAALGSAPTAAVFFCTYEATKNALRSRLLGGESAGVHMAAASAGEVAACMLRVPVEIVKQRRQASPGTRSTNIARMVLREEGLRGFYRGFTSTVFRDLPFSLIQFPLWEYFKVLWSRHLNEGSALSALESATCGAVSGGMSAAITTPLDVAKTRIMLAESGSEIAKRASLYFTLSEVFKEKGLQSLFAGVTPRTIWMTLGGFFFFGSYEKSKQLVMPYLT